MTSRNLKRYLAAAALPFALMPVSAVAAFDAGKDHQLCVASSPKECGAECLSYCKSAVMNDPGDADAMEMVARAVLSGPKPRDVPLVDTMLSMCSELNLPESSKCDYLYGMVTAFPKAYYVDDRRGNRYSAMARFNLAADKGHVGAKIAQAVFWANGVGDTPDFKAAYQKFASIAGSENLGTASYLYALMLKNGTGGEKNALLAGHHLKKASEYLKNHAPAGDEKIIAMLVADMAVTFANARITHEIAWSATLRDMADGLPFSERLLIKVMKENEAADVAGYLLQFYELELLAAEWGSREASDVVEKIERVAAGTLHEKSMAKIKSKIATVSADSIKDAQKISEGNLKDLIVYHGGRRLIAD